MSDGRRRFDPESAQQFKDTIDQEIDLIENTVIPSYFKGDGALGKMPAFGISPAGQELSGKYTEFHSGVWNDLQGVLTTYHAISDALKESIEGNVDADETSAENVESTVREAEEL